MCYNQAELAQFNFMAGELHKDIKDGKKEIAKIIENNITPNYNKIENFIKIFNRKIEDKLEDVFEYNCNNIIKYFKDRSKIPIRICIKSIDQNYNIKDYYRHGKEYRVPLFHYTENTGFDKIIKNGVYYLNNDLPSKACAGRYDNPRINKNQIIKYKEKLMVSNNHDDWMTCWNYLDDSGRYMMPLTESCYRSTLIIPMTLWNNNLSEKFQAHFHVTKDEKTEFPYRLIFGLLCFDHIDTNFFIEELDIQIGYFIADFLSLYLITESMYCKYSKTYIDTEKILTTYHKKGEQDANNSTIN